MKIFTVIGGVNGVGKSSLTGLLLSERSDLGIVIDTDRLTARLGGDTIKGGRSAVLRINDCLERGLSLTQETTLSGNRTLKTVLRARELGYRIRLYYVGVSSAEECIGRIACRVRKGGHFIPEKDVRRRFMSRFYDILRVLPYCDEARFFDNENGFTEAAEYKNGTLIIKTDTPPEWIKELKKRTDKVF